MELVGVVVVEGVVGHVEVVVEGVVVLEGVVGQVVVVGVVGVCPALLLWVRWGRCCRRCEEAVVGVGMSMHLLLD